MEGSKGCQEPDSSLTVCDVFLSCPPIGGSTSPFIDEGDGFTSERERVRMLPSLVAHVYQALLSYSGGYQIMVSAYNTVDAAVECQDGCRVLLRARYGLWYSGFDL